MDDSDAVVRNNRILFTQFWPMIVSYKTRAQYHNQDIDIDTGKVQDVSNYHKDLSCCPFIATPTSLQPLLLP